MKPLVPKTFPEHVFPQTSGGLDNDMLHHTDTNRYCGVTAVGGCIYGCYSNGVSSRGLEELEVFM
jgi:hypothetical protein